MRDRVAHTQSSLVVVGQPCLRDPRRDDRLIEELAELLAAALIADVHQFPKPLESQADRESTVVSPRVPVHSGESDARADFAREAGR